MCMLSVITRTLFSDTPYLYLPPAAIGSSNITLGYHGYNNKWPSSDLVTLTVKVALSDISSPPWVVSHRMLCSYIVMCIPLISLT